MMTASSHVDILHVFLGQCLHQTTSYVCTILGSDIVLHYVCRVLLKSFSSIVHVPFLKLFCKLRLAQKNDKWEGSGKLERVGGREAGQSMEADMYQRCELGRFVLATCIERLALVLSYSSRNDCDGTLPHARATVIGAVGNVLVSCGARDVEAHACYRCSKCCGGIRLPFVTRVCKDICACFFL